MDNDWRSVSGVFRSPDRGESGSHSAQPENRQSRETEKTQMGRRRGETLRSPNNMSLDRRKVSSC